MVTQRTVITLPVMGVASVHAIGEPLQSSFASGPTLAHSSRPEPFF